MLFIKHLDSRRVTTLLVYVDDIIVTGNDEKKIQTLRQYLTKEFEIKELKLFILSREFLFLSKNV